MNLDGYKNAGKTILSPTSSYKIFYQDIINKEAEQDETLLLLHGFPESSFSFHKVLPEMTRKFSRIILPDFIGFGYSDKPKKNYAYSISDHANVACDVLAHLGIIDAHLICHDMGDTVGTELLSRQVENMLPPTFKGFRSVIFTNGSMAIEHASLRITQKILLTPFGFVLSRLSLKKIFTHQIRSAHGNNNITSDDIDRLWQQLNLKGGKNIIHLLILYYKDRIRYEASRYLPALGKLQIPIYFCWGTDDQVARLPIPYDIQKRFCPEAKIIEVQGMGHFGQIAEPVLWAKNVMKIYTDES